MDLEGFILGSRSCPHFLGKGYPAVISGRLSLTPLAHRRPRAMSEATRTISAFFIRACVLRCFSHVRLFANLWTIAHQTPLSMGFSKQRYSSIAMPSSRGSSQPRSNPYVLCLLHWQVGSLPLELRGKPTFSYNALQIPFAWISYSNCICIWLLK